MFAWSSFRYSPCGGYDLFVASMYVCFPLFASFSTCSVIALAAVMCVSSSIRYSPCGGYDTFLALLLLCISDVVRYLFGAQRAFRLFLWIQFSDGLALCLSMFRCGASVSTCPRSLGRRLYNVGSSPGFLRDVSTSCVFLRLLASLRARFRFALECCRLQ